MSKKCIISGITAEQTRGTPKTGYPALSPGIELILKDLGYDTELGACRVDTNEERLRDADVLVMGLAPVISIGSRYLYGALDAIAKARKYGCAQLWFISDWQVDLLHGAIKSNLNEPHRVTKFFMRHRTDFLWAVHHTDELIATMEAIRDRPWPDTMVPAHPWHTDMPRITRYLPSRRIHYFDPTPYTSGLWPASPDQASPEDRKREWVLAALADYDEWTTSQGFTWPVRNFGGKTNVDAGNGDGTTKINPRVQESEVHEQYAQTWGGLAPAHKLVGCGWWRSRYDFILKNGGVLFGDPTEMALMGDAFTTPLNEIESMSAVDLSNLQKAQRDTHQIESKESVMATFESAIQKATADI